MSKALWAAYVAAVALIMGMGTVSAAHASPATNNDQMFISFLDGHGVSEHITDMNTAVQSGHMACNELAAGKGEITIEMDVAGMNPGLSRADASWLIAGAKKAFCAGE